MVEAEPTPYAAVPVSRELAGLRLRAEAHARAADDLDLLELVDELREQDPSMWPHLWAPCCAMAARRTGDPRAWPLLDEAVVLGFAQPQLLAPELEDAFGDDADWPAALERMRVGQPPALALLDWPDPPPQHPVVLDRIAPDRELRLAERVPAEAIDRASAWRTAQQVLTWVRRSWEHANDHVERPDALDVLDRVATGERFACVEYSIVLSQALNAVGIPARRVQALQAPHHVGVGRGHVVSEAWIDDLARWVLLDGQNGAYWADPDGRPDAPLGAPDLVARHHADRPARMVGLVTEIDEGAQALWWSHFATVLTTGTGVADTLALSFQGASLVKAGRLSRTFDHTHPPLDDVAVGTTGDLDDPRLRLVAHHPHATGFRISGEGWSDDVGLDAPWPLRPGEHRATVAVLTAYGAGRPHPLAWRA